MDLQTADLEDYKQVLNPTKIAIYRTFKENGESSSTKPIDTEGLDRPLDIKVDKESFYNEELLRKIKKETGINVFLEDPSIHGLLDGSKVYDEGFYFYTASLNLSLNQLRNLDLFGEYNEDMSQNNDLKDQPNFSHNEIYQLAKKIGFPTSFEL